MSQIIKEVILGFVNRRLFHFPMRNLMSKKVIFNGIELSLPKYNASATTIFDYLENIQTHLEKGLGDDDGNFELSINVDFSASEPPKHKIHSNGSTNKKTKEKVARILESSLDGEDNHVSGSVRVNLLVEDKKV